MLASTVLISALERFLRPSLRISLQGAGQERLAKLMEKQRSPPLRIESFSIPCEFSGERSHISSISFCLQNPSLASLTVAKAAEATPSTRLYAT